MLITLAYCKVTSARIKLVASGAEQFDVYMHVYVPTMLLKLHIELLVVTSQRFEGFREMLFTFKY